MTNRDAVLRAAFCTAAEARGTSGYRRAIERFVHLHRIWPLIEYQQAILAAERDLEERLTAVEREPWLVHELWPAEFGPVPGAPSVLQERLA